MHYLDRYMGGPQDGKLEKSPTSKSFPKYRLYALGQELYGIYEYEKSDVTEHTTERIYRYLRSDTLEAGRAFLDAYNNWLPASDEK